MTGSQVASTAEAHDRPAEVGEMIDGYRVERVVTTRPGLHTLVEATARDGRRVTLKLLAKPLSSDKDFRRRLQRLTRARASLAHPHLLPLLGVGQSGRRLYLASPATGGRSLADRLCEGPVSPEEAIRLLAEVAGALEAAGSEGLLHRDLAPENILLVGYEPPRALLTDFGIAVPPARGCDLFGAVEAVDYRSPEELRGEPLEPQSSVYSLACILVECLTGAPPYPYDRPLLTLHAHLVNPPPLVSERGRDLPPALDGVIVTALAKNPLERHRSPAALMRAAREAAGVEAPIPVISHAQEAHRDATLAPPAEAPGPAEPARHPARKGRGSAGPPSAASAKPARTTRRRRPHAAFAAAGIALVASAAGGYSLGTVGSGQPTAPAAGTVSANVRAERAERAQMAAYVQNVNQAVEELGTRRAAARRRLRGADRAAGQAAQARALAAAYERAGEALADGAAAASASPALGERLRATARAYRRLATAARERDRRAWRSASDAARERERDVRRELGSLQQA